ncbi:MAG: iron ABC transporter ATP-binding protein [Chloroflexota bacterium]
MGGWVSFDEDGGRRREDGGAPSSLLEVHHISKAFGSTPVLRDVSLRVAEGETVVLLGASGSGKTTLLRIIAGLETPDSGRVTFDGRDLAGVLVHRRGFGLMFQDLALFPHLNVFDNVAFGLRMAGLSRAEVAARVEEALELVGLSGFAHRDVHTLSGGERQRVALARSLAPRPRLLMLDEPLGALDRVLRDQLIAELRDILKGVGVTALYVTHDQAEAFVLADRIALLHQGKIEQEGTPEEVYRHPATPFVARFLGLTNLLPGRVTQVQPTPTVTYLTVATPIGPLTLSLDGAGPPDQSEVTVLVRPEAATVLPQAGAMNEAAVVSGTLVERIFQGGRYRIRVRLAGHIEMNLEIGEKEALPAPGEPIRLALRREAVSLLPALA